MTGRWSVALVSMPFMDAFRPSIQLGLLGAILRERGHEVTTVHANLDFAAQLGVERYQPLTDHRGHQLGDWLFSVEAFGAEAPDPGARMLDDLHLDPGVRAVRDVEVPRYLDRLVASEPWGDHRIVGFSCTFQQSVASIALARRLKAAHPELIVVFGGANLDGPMGAELLRTTGCVDVVVNGEGDDALPALVAELAAGRTGAGVPGVIVRDGARVRNTPPGPLFDALDKSPVPEYTEYFERAATLGIVPEGARRRVNLPFESARGCWWGAKHHCTFCGLNGASMRFRAKSAARVADELATQSRRHHTFSFSAVDNILDPAALRELLPVLAGGPANYDLFYEVKANLRRADVRLLAEAGVRHIQPGIESLSSAVLAPDGQGVTAAQNVNVLRWSRYYGIDVAWNLLWGFDGETAADYATQVALVGRLWHLQPPGVAARVWLERFSPMFAQAVRAADPAPVPERSYAYVYPRATDLAQIAYFFDPPRPAPLADSAYAPLVDAVAAWAAAWDAAPRPTLTYRWSPGVLEIEDERGQGADGVYSFDGPIADIYATCTERPIGVGAIRAALDLDWPAAQVEAVLGAYEQRGLVLRDGNRWLTLALPAGGR